MYMGYNYERTKDKGQRHGRLGSSVLLFAFCSGIVFSSGYSGTCCAGTMSSRKFFLPSDDKKNILDADGVSKDSLKSSEKNTVGNNESENAYKSQFVNSKNSKKVKATVQGFDNKYNLEDGISNKTSQENILEKPNSQGKLVGKNVIKNLYNKNSKISLKNNAASLSLITISTSVAVGAASAALHNILKSESNKSEPEQNIDSIDDDKNDPDENDPNKPEQNIDSIDDDKSDSDENDPNKNDPGKITPEPKYEKSLNLLKPILYTSGSVLIYIVLHYVAKSLLFFGVWTKSKGNKPTLYKDIEEFKIPKHHETRALIAYKTEYKYKFGKFNDKGIFEECENGRSCKHKEHKLTCVVEKDTSGEKYNKNKRDTIILTFGGNFTEGRDMINRIRVNGRGIMGKVNEDNFEECKEVDCKHKEHKWMYVDGKLNYTAASIVPRGYYSNENILKKLGKAGEEALYEDAENLYNYVTDELGYKNVIIHGYCQGGPVAAHLVKYAEEKATEGKQNKVIGLVLSGPMDGVYSSVSKNFSKKFGDNFFSKIAGSILGGIGKFLLPFNSLDTYKNLKNIKNKDLPIICLSGADKDFLSFEKTEIDKRLRDIGFKNVTTGIYKKSDHKVIFEEDFIKIEQTEKQVVMKPPDIYTGNGVIVTDVNGKNRELKDNIFDWNIQ